MPLSANWYLINAFPSDLLLASLSLVGVVLNPSSWSHQCGGQCEPPFTASLQTGPSYRLEKLSCAPQLQTRGSVCAA